MPQVFSTIQVLLPGRGPGPRVRGAGGGHRAVTIVGQLLGGLLISGVLSTARQVGGVLGVALIGVLFFGSLPHTGHSATGAYAHALVIGCSFNVLATVLATGLVLALPRTANRASEAT